MYYFPFSLPVNCPLSIVHFIRFLLLIHCQLYVVHCALGQDADSAQNARMTIFQLRLQADEATEKGKYMQSLHYWVDILEIDPDNPENYAERSLVFQKMGDYPAAVSDCHSIIRLIPEHYRGYWRRAELYFIQRKYSHALADLNRAVEYSGNSNIKHAILFDRGLCLEQMRNFRAAADDYLAILSYTPRHLKAQHHLGMVYNELSMPDSSIHYLRATILQVPDYAPAYISLGYTLTDQGKYDEAIVALDYALSLSGENDYQRALCLNNRGYCRLQIKDLKNAWSDLSQARRLLPHHPYIYRNIAAWHVVNNHRAAACRYWHKAQQYGFEQQYGDEVRQLIERYCR